MSFHDYRKKEEIHTLHLTRRELGLLFHQSWLLFADIDDDVKHGGTSRIMTWQDWYGKDAVSGVYLKTKMEVDAHYDNWCKDLQRKDPFAKPFCYNEKHENYYKNHMEVA